MFNDIVNFFNGALGQALAYLGGVAGADVLVGIVLAGVLRKFSLSRLFDFVETTVGFQKSVLFLGAVLIMILNRQPLTTAVVSVMAMGYATSILPDLYNKLSTLIFGGKLPLSAPLASSAVGVH